MKKLVLVFLIFLSFSCGVSLLEAMSFFEDASQQDIQDFTAMLEAKSCGGESQQDIISTLRQDVAVHLILYFNVFIKLKIEDEEVCRSIDKRLIKKFRQKLSKGRLLSVLTIDDFHEIIEKELNSLFNSIKKEEIIKIRCNISNKKRRKKKISVFKKKLRSVKSSVKKEIYFFIKVILKKQRVKINIKRFKKENRILHKLAINILNSILNQTSSEESFGACHDDFLDW